MSCSNNAPADKQNATPASSEKTGSLNIRYIDADSIAAHYNLAKDFSEAQLRSISKIDNAQRTRGAELQKLANSIQQKVNSNGYLSQASYEEDMKNLNKKQADAENYLASLQCEGVAFCLSAGALLEHDIATTANMSISDLAQSASFFIVIC